MIAWSARVGITGYANSPVIGDGVIYVPSQGSDHNWSDMEDGLYALDADSGERVWFAPADEDLNGATLTDELVLAGADSGTLYAFSRGTGDLVWTAPSPSPIRFGPVIHQGTAYLASNGPVVRIDLGSGNVLSPIGTSDRWSDRDGLSAQHDLLVRTALDGSIETIDLSVTPPVVHTIRRQSTAPAMRGHRRSLRTIGSFNSTPT